LKELTTLETKYENSLNKSIDLVNTSATTASSYYKLLLAELSQGTGTTAQNIASSLSGIIFNFEKTFLPQW